MYGVSGEVCWRVGKGCGERNGEDVGKCVEVWGLNTLLIPHISLPSPFPTSPLTFPTPHHTFLHLLHTSFNSSDGRVVWSVCLLSCRLGFNSESGQTNDFKNWYSQLPCLTLSIKGTVWRTSRQVYLLCRWEWHLAGFPHLGVVDRWPATPKRARIAH